MKEISPIKLIKKPHVGNTLNNLIVIKFKNYQKISLKMNINKN